MAQPGRTESDAEAIDRLLRTFGSPYITVTEGTEGAGVTTLYAAADAQGVPAITTELGYGATLSPPGLALAENGLKRVLKEYDIAPAVQTQDPETPRVVRAQGPNGSVYSPCDGLFEPFAKPGDEVAAGQAAGVIHPFGDADAQPVELQFAASGIIIFRRFPTLTELGDSLFGVMVEDKPE